MDQPTPALDKNTSKKGNGTGGLGPIEYSFIKDLKNTKAKISLFELLKFYLVKINLFKVVEFGAPENTKQSLGQILDIATLSGSKSKSKTPTFLLTFKI